MKYSLRLKNFPVSFYAVILGMAGWTIAVQRAEEVLGLSGHVSLVLLYASLAVFGIITVTYLIKCMVFRADVAAEMKHPVRLNFFPAFSVSLLLFSIAFLQINADVSRGFWLAGAVLHFIFTIRVLTYWIQSEHLQVVHMNPSWFIPVVGNILVPVAGVAFYSPELSWFFFSIGAVFWLVLFTILIYRIVFHQPIQSKLLPMFFIMIAPPAVGFVAYVKLTGGLDTVARLLYYFALFLFVLLVSQLKYIHKATFYLSWWAYSFPIAALTIASVLMYHLTGLLFFQIIGWIFLALITGILLFLLTRTIHSILKKNVCIEE